MSRRRPAALALAALLAVLVPTFPTGGDRAFAQPEATGATLGPLIEQTLWLAPEDAFAFTAAVTTTAPIADPSVVVRFGETVDRAAFLDGIADGALGRTVTRTTEAVLVDGALSVTLAPADDTSGVPRLPRLDTGVHPVVVELRNGTTPLAGLRTHVVVLPDTDAPPRPLGVATLLERIVGPGLQPDGTVVVEPDDLAWLGALTSLLTALPSTGTETADPPEVSVLVTPELIDGLITGSDAASAGTVASLTAVLPDHEVLLSPWVPLDEALWIAIGEPAVVEELLVRGAAAFDELFVPADVQDILVLDATAGDDTVEGLVGLGIERFIVRADAVDPPVDTLGAVRLGSSTPRAEALIAAPSVTSHLTGTDPTLAGTTAAAELATLWFAAPEEPRGLVLTPDASAVLDVEALRVLLTEISASPLLDSTGLDALFDRLPPAPSEPVALVDDPSVPVGDAGRRRAALHDQVDSYEAMLGGPQPLSSRLRDLLDAATAVSLTATSRTAYLDAVELAVGRGSQGITIPSGQAFNLTSRGAVLDVRVDNAMGHDTHVLIRFASDSRVEFPSGPSQRVVLAPGENVLEFEVRTRSTGVARVDIAVTSPDGVIALAEGTVRVRSTALTGVALILGGGAILVLLVWWARQIAAARRQRRGA